MRGDQGGDRVLILASMFNTNVSCSASCFRFFAFLLITVKHRSCAKLLLTVVLAPPEHGARGENVACVWAQQGDSQCI